LVSFTRAYVPLDGSVALQMHYAFSNSPVALIDALVFSCSVLAVFVPKVYNNPFQKTKKQKKVIL
jgi:hypothetical protein